MPNSSLLVRVKWITCGCRPRLNPILRKREVLLQPTPEAIRVFNKSHAKKIGLFHVTLLKRLHERGLRVRFWTALN